jgi:glutathione S-transferase
MAMKLYVFPIAPNPTKVRLYLAEKRAAGAAIDVEEITVSLIEGEQKQPAHLARNPFGNLPVLETAPGDFLCESLPIIEYLEELHPDPPLIGATPRERARVRQLERRIDLGLLIPIARIVHTTRSPLGLPPNPEVAAYFERQLPSVLDHLEQLLADGRPFLAGAQITLADCTLTAGLQFGRFRELAVLEHHPGLRRWEERYCNRPEIDGILVV